MGRVRYSFQEISDILMKGVLHSSLKALRTSIPWLQAEGSGCASSGGQLQNRTTDEEDLNKRPFSRCTSLHLLSDSCRNYSGSISACLPPPPTFGQVGFSHRVG